MLSVRREPEPSENPARPDHLAVREYGRAMIATTDDDRSRPFLIPVAPVRLAGVVVGQQLSVPTRARRDGIRLRAVFA